MRRIDGIIGNRYDDPELDEKLKAYERDDSLERVAIDLSERKKSRLRVETDAGTDLGIIVDHSELRAGDVLFVDDEQAVVVRFQRREAYVIELPEPGEGAIHAAVELGHRIGNQHWDIAVEDRTVYVPVEADKHIIEDVLNDYISSGATTRYEEVDARLFLESPDDRRAAHSRNHAHDNHAHDSNDEEARTHSHDHETENE